MHFSKYQNIFVLWTGLRSIQAKNIFLKRNHVCLLFFPDPLPIMATIISQNYSAARCVSASSPGHNHMQTTTKISWNFFIFTQGWKWKFFKWRQNRQLSNFVPAFKGLWIIREYYLFGNAIQGQLKIYHKYNIHLILIFIKTHSAQNKGKTTYSKGGHGKHGEKLKNFSPKNNLNFAAISILNGESRMVGHLKEMLERSFWWEIPR